MRFIHTSDWHLGRQFNRANLIDDQCMCSISSLSSRDAKVDAVVIAGDLYDRAIRNAAVSLCDKILCDLSLGLNCP